ncbi:hypothetical protein WDU94_002909 [Cyamophila willieti]
MSDSEEEDQEFALYGTLLDPLEEDTVQAKKPISVQDQVATDKHGKRRFHGAFTGGFSAGFCNTVGSLEGWTPSTFKSSRSAKGSTSVTQKPEDFMDEEDMSVFGIAPKSIQVSSSFEGKSGEGQQRRHRSFAGTTIPGVPVLESLLQPVQDTIGNKLLSRMGWKPGQGIGPRLSKQDKRLASDQDKTRRKIYGCSLPDQEERKGRGDDEEDGIEMEEEEGEEDESGFTYAPDEYLPYLVKPKDNEFGLGYKGLDRKPVLSNEKQGFSLFGEEDIPGSGAATNDSGVTFIGRNNKKVRIHGQAFGVGAFEEEDDDIYATEDMTRYDFSLAPSGSRTTTKSKKPDPTPAAKDGEVVGFRKSETECLFVKMFPPPQLPSNYTPRCPFSCEIQSSNLASSQLISLSSQNQLISVDQSDHPIKQARSAFERAAILDEPLPVVRSQTAKNGIGSLGSCTNTNLEPNSNMRTTTDTNYPCQSVKIETPPEGTISNDTPTHLKQAQPLFRPFATEPEKQTRYEAYLNFVKLGMKDKLSTIQPKTMTEWERQREATEFESAQKLYTPLSGAMADRFTHGSQPDDINPLTKTERFAKDAAEETLRQAAKNKMFGKLTREYSVWVPSDLLCKRFNIKPPALIEARKRQRQSRNYSLFEFLNEEKSERNVDNSKKSNSLMDQNNEIGISSSNSESSNKVTKNDRDNNKISRLPNPLRDENDDVRLKEQSVGGGEPMEKRLEDLNKVDLFKAIFLSSDEEEEEESNNEPEDQTIHNRQVEQTTSNIDTRGIEETPIIKRDESEQTPDLNSGEGSTTSKNKQTSSKDNNKESSDTRNNLMEHNPQNNPMKTMEMTSKENEGRQSENSEINNCDDLYGPQLPSQLSNKIGDKVGEGEHININAANTGLEVHPNLGNDIMSLSKKRNAEVVGVRFEKPTKLGKEKNKTFQESKQDNENILKIKEKVVNGEKSANELGEQIVKVKNVPKEDDEDDMWVDADEINEDENEGKRKTSDKSSKHKKPGRKTDDRTDKRHKKHSKKSKRKYRTNSSSDSDSDSSQTGKKTSGKRDKTKTCKRKHRDSSSSSSEYEKRKRKSRRKHSDSESTTESDGRRSESKDRKHKPKSSSKRRQCPSSSEDEKKRHKSKRKHKKHKR